MIDDEASLAEEKPALKRQIELDRPGMEIPGR